MHQLITVHPDNPSARGIKLAAKQLQQGGVIVYPTDSTYALGCNIGNKTALDRIRRIRRLGDRHNFTLVCSDLSSLATYAQVPNSAYRILKAHTPGPYTFVLKASPEVPRRLMHPKRRTIGLRVPKHNVAQALLAELAEPVMSTSLILPDDGRPLSEIDEIRECVGKLVEVIIDGGSCGVEPTTMVELVEGPPRLLREGKGDVGPFV